MPSVHRTCTAGHGCYFWVTRCRLGIMAVFTARKCMEEFTFYVALFPNEEKKIREVIAQLDVLRKKTAVLERAFLRFDRTQSAVTLWPRINEQFVQIHRTLQAASHAVEDVRKPRKPF